MNKLHRIWTYLWLFFTLLPYILITGFLVHTVLQEPVMSSGELEGYIYFSWHFGIVVSSLWLMSLLLNLIHLQSNQKVTKRSRDWWVLKLVLGNAISAVKYWTSYVRNPDLDKPR